MDVTADCDFLKFIDIDFYERVERLKDFSSLLNDHGGVLLVQDFTITLILHELDAEFWCYVLYGIQSRSRIGILNENR